MCGRIALIQPEEKSLKKRFNLTKIPKNLKPRYNISPSQDIPVICNDSPQELTMLRWGLIPHWAKEENTKYSMINARAETITERPAYRWPVKHRRCLIIADTFYEWKKEKDHKQPYRFMMKDAGAFAFAGIWGQWKKDDTEIATCSIITTMSNQLMRPIHDRMPVILAPEYEQLWLSDIDLEHVQRLIQSHENKTMTAYPISTLVNAPLNDGPDVIQSME